MADSVDTRAVLAAEGITASIDDQSLVAPTDITVSAGECLALTGPNGSGKTTLLRLLSGRLAPTGGSVLLDDEPVDERSDEVRAALAILIGVPALYPDLTVGDHLQLVHATWGLDGEVDTDLARFGIDGLRDRFVHELSSGQQQLFSLALVFSRPSRVILLDEPEQRLDADRKDLLAAAVEEVLAEGRSVVMACHDHDLVARLAHRQVDL
ncbi:ABC transporter ATP-binding protein [Aeromicrobium sp. YIM 150415]|uniref:ABC transporter ATP-binding protein n=1 Tax=Aeromicrobium sp. YIM 150415 TaxID=2803912 RepID=UPI001964A697|nr:ABC transporter ATP-binding protein [Aeromicrobium sp. YIM 150415]MBM9463945.1 ABC transporter ATP-binding protein [Aeromicrobium sp. YIM 150415]